MKTKTLSILSIACLAAVSGCSDLYRADADRQVQKLIQERQKQTTGYNAKVEAESTPPVNPTSKSYQSVPLTKQTEESDPPVTRVVRMLPVAPLGPPVPPENPITDSDSLIYQTANELQKSRFVQGPPTELGYIIKLDLFSAIKYAVQNSRQYQNEMESLYLSALDVTLERHLFTPRPFVTTEARYTGGQLDSDYQSAFNVTQRVGVRQRLPYGGEVVAQGLVGFVNALNGNVTDGEDAELALSTSIPLMRGAGLVNLEPLIASERELVYSVRDFETYRRQFAVDVASRYFRVIIRYQALRNRLINFRNLQDLVIRSEAMFDAGRVTALDVQRSQQSLLSGEDLLNGAMVSLQSDLDAFKTIIGMPVNQPLELANIDVEVAKLGMTIRDPESAALIYRLDLQTSLDRIEDARRGVSNAKNELGPDLNLTAGGTLGNRDSTVARRIDARTLEYNAGLTFDLPIDRLPERNAFRRALISLERSKRNAIELRENILASVRSDQRAIDSARQSMLIQQKGMDLARTRLDAANQQLLLGNSNAARDVVDAQSSLLNAQDSYDRAKAELTIQMLQYLRDTGTLRIDPDAGELGVAMKRD